MTPNDDPKEQGAAEDAKAKPKDDAITLLKNDHRAVEALFEKFEKAKRRAEKQKIALQICRELNIHTTLEEEIFYPACREHIDDAPLDEAQVEHDSCKILIGEIMNGAPNEAFYDAKVKVLSELIKHHVNEEERRQEGIFAKAKAAGVDTDEIAIQLMERKEELNADPEEADAAPVPVSFTTLEFAEEEEPEPRNTRPMNAGQRAGNGHRSQRGEPERDARGRFQREDDGEDYGAQRMRGRGRQDDDDRGDRGQGGWFGDREGHARAAREGWRRSGQEYAREGGSGYGDPRARGRSEPRYEPQARGRDEDDYGRRRRRDEDDDQDYRR